MTSEGWETTEETPHTIHLPGQSFNATRSVMFKDGYQLLTTYTFTDGDYSVGTLSRFQVMQLMKRLRSQIPIGALVRVIVEVNGDPRAAEKIADEYLQTNLPSIMAGLRGAHLGAH